MAATMTPRRLITAIAILFLLCAAVGRGAEKEGDEPAGKRKPAAKPIPVAKLDRSTPVDFEKEVLPALSANCLACHNKTKAKADLVLETPADILKGGENGPAVVPGKSAVSLILQAAAHQGETVMPPVGNKVAAVDLTGEQLGLIRLWIDQGAKGEVKAAAPVAWQAVPESLQPVYAVAVSADGALAACGRGNQVFVYDLKSGRQVARLADPALTSAGNGRGAAHRDLVQSLAFSPDGKLLATGGYREVKLWRVPAELKNAAEAKDAKDSKDAKETKGSKDAKETKASKDGKPPKDAKGADDLKVAKDAKADPRADVSWPIARTLGAGDGSSPLADRVNALAFTPNGRRLVTGGGVPSRAGEVRVWDVESGKVERSLDDLHSDTVLALSVSDDGKLLASGGADKFVRITDLSTGKVAFSFEGHSHHVLGVSLRHDGKLVASAGADNTLRFWDVAETVAERRKPVQGFDKEVTCVAFVGETDQVIAASGEGKVRMVKQVKDGGSDVRSFAGANDYVYAVAVTPDGKTVVAGGQDGVLRAWAVADGKALGTFGAGGGEK